VPFRAEKFIPDRQKILAEENRGGIETDSGEIYLRLIEHDENRRRDSCS
jgi:hypothetical protein